MPRQNRRHEPEPFRPIGGAATDRVEWRGLDYLVRHIAGASATKTYRCPGCDHEITPGQPHVVVWPDDSPGTDDRRHWHGGCWNARDTRRPSGRA